MSLHGGLFENVARKLSGFLIFPGSDSTNILHFNSKLHEKAEKKWKRERGWQDWQSIAQRTMERKDVPSLFEF